MFKLEILNMPIQKKILLNHEELFLNIEIFGGKRRTFSIVYGKCEIYKWL